MTPSPTQSNVMAALRSFLLAVLPAGVEVLQAQLNRVPEPSGANYVLMTPRRLTRLRTNVDRSWDALFTGSIAGATMTITAVDPDLPGRLAVGSTVFGVGVAPGTLVAALGSGSGGVGTYAVTPAQNVASRALSAGMVTVEQGTEVAVQLDFHSDTKVDVSGDMASTVGTLFRSGFAVRQFASQDPNYGVVPLYADDPAQRPFFNDQQQAETRWVVEAMLQANIVVSVPQQFADSVVLGVVSVEATYAP